jgi:putative transmembrane protein PGPGW
MVLKNARRVVIAVVGGTVLLFSLVGYVMPIIPGIPLTFLGLAILATEFVWARRLLKKAKEKARDIMGGFPAVFSSDKPDENKSEAKP